MFCHAPMKKNSYWKGEGIALRKSSCFPPCGLRFVDGKNYSNGRQIERQKELVLLTNIIVVQQRLLSSLLRNVQLTAWNCSARRNECQQRLVQNNRPSFFSIDRRQSDALMRRLGLPLVWKAFYDATLEPSRDLARLAQQYIKQTLKDLLVNHSIQGST